MSPTSCADSIVELVENIEILSDVFIRMNGRSDALSLCYKGLTSELNKDHRVPIILKRKLQTILASLSYSASPSTVNIVVNRVLWTYLRHDMRRLIDELEILLLFDLKEETDSPAKLSDLKERIRSKKDLIDKCFLSDEEWLLLIMDVAGIITDVAQQILTPESDVRDKDFIEYALENLRSICNMKFNGHTISAD